MSLFPLVYQSLFPVCLNKLNEDGNEKKPIPFYDQINLNLNPMQCHRLPFQNRILVWNRETTLHIFWSRKFYILHLSSNCVNGTVEHEMQGSQPNLVHLSFQLNDSVYIGRKPQIKWLKDQIIPIKCLKKFAIFVLQSHSLHGLVCVSVFVFVSNTFYPLTLDPCAFEIPALKEPKHLLFVSCRGRLCPVCLKRMWN